MNEIDETQWTRILGMRLKRRQKNHAVTQVLDMFVITMIDIWNRFVADDMDFLNEIETLRKYVNRNLQIIARDYNNKVPMISPEWDIK